MRLSSNTEWMVIAGIILYIAFVPSIPAVREMLSQPIGKAIALGAIVYVWKYVSTTVAILLVVAYIRCATSNVFEMFSEPTCACDPEFSFDAVSKKCKKDGEADREPVSCTCATGEVYDSIGKQCQANSSMTQPIPAVPVAPSVPEVMSAETGNSAPVSTPPPNSTISTAPMTTASNMMQGVPPASTSTAGVQPSTKSDAGSPL